MISGICGFNFQSQSCGFFFKSLIDSVIDLIFSDEEETAFLFKKNF